MQFCTKFIELMVFGKCHKNKQTSKSSGEKRVKWTFKQRRGLWQNELVVSAKLLVKKGCGHKKCYPKKGLFDLVIHA
jgi:hypothetical protein